MKFLVPQFIDVEDKIFGPLSFKQFLYLAGGVGMCVIMFQFGGFFLAVLVGVPFLGFGTALAFFKINSRPFITTVQNALYFSMNSKLYLWKRRAAKRAQERKQEKMESKQYVPKVSENKLKNLAWSLDIKESMYTDESQVK